MYYLRPFKVRLGALFPGMDKGGDGDVELGSIKSDMGLIDSFPAPPLDSRLSFKMSPVTSLFILMASFSTEGSPFSSRTHS